MWRLARDYANGESGAATSAERKQPDVSDKLKNLLTAVRLCQHFPPNGTSPCALANNPARQKTLTASPRPRCSCDLGVFTPQFSDSVCFLRESLARLVWRRGQICETPTANCYKTNRSCCETGRYLPIAEVCHRWWFHPDKKVTYLFDLI